VKKTPTKLTLAKETIRRLTGNQVKAARGAAATENPFCDTCTAITTCPTDLTCLPCTTAIRN